MEEWRPRPSGFIEMFFRRMYGQTFGINDVFSGLDRLDPEHLDFLAIMSIAQLLQHNAPPDHMVDYTIRNVAFGIIRHFLGAQWAIDNALPSSRETSPQTKKGRIFFRSDALDDKEAAYRWHFRVMRLGESLYNFQNVPGIRQRIRQIKSGDLESGHGEFLCAKLLASPVFELRFIEPKFVKGSDYDCEFTAPGGRILHGEIKVKSESTDYGQKTIYNTLEHARRQLPTNLPGVIFLKLPEGWVNEPNYETVTREAIRKIFRQSNRVVAISLMWEEWLPIGDVRFTHLGHQVIGNTRSPLYSDDVPRCFEVAKATALKNDGWFTIGPHVARHFAAMQAFVRDNLTSGDDSTKL